MAGKGWARFGFATGIGASICGNIAHSFVHDPGKTKSHPQPGAIIASAFWPVALLISIEVISRVAWPSGKRWQFVRYGGLSVVAAIAAVISYIHLYGVLMAYHESRLSASLGPLAVDGLMAVSSGALLALAPRSAAPVDPPALPTAPFLPLPPPAMADDLPPPPASTNGKRGSVATTEERYEAARRQVEQLADDLGREPTAQELAEKDKSGMSRRWWSDRLTEYRKHART